MRKMEHVELHQAFMWDCPECGLENFARSVRLELSPEEIEEMSENFGVASSTDSRFSIIPENVTCKHCEKKFITD